MDDEFRERNDELFEETNAGEDALSETELGKAFERLCVSKAEEFRMLGYESITGPDVWECVNDKYRKKGKPPMHQVVNDILSLKVTQFMNWMTMRVYKEGSF